MRNEKKQGHTPHELDRIIIHTSHMSTVKDHWTGILLAGSRLFVDVIHSSCEWTRTAVVLLQKMLWIYCGQLNWQVKAEENREHKTHSSHGHKTLFFSTICAFRGVTITHIIKRDHVKLKTIVKIQKCLFGGYYIVYSLRWWRRRRRRNVSDSPGFESTLSNLIRKAKAVVDGAQWRDGAGDDDNNMSEV